jgi:hypothetical protein
MLHTTCSAVLCFALPFALVVRFRAGGRSSINKYPSWLVLGWLLHTDIDDDAYFALMLKRAWQMEWAVYTDGSFA